MRDSMQGQAALIGADIAIGSPGGAVVHQGLGFTIRSAQLTLHVFLDSAARENG